jgi:hypothetical protein
MLNTRGMLRGAIAAVTLIIAFAVFSSANDVVDDWDKATPPPKPELKAVTLDGPTTAFLILDMAKGCGRPRCKDTIPAVKRIHDAARAAGAMFWYSVPGDAAVARPDGTLEGAADTGFAPHAGEWEHERGGDKFYGSHLEEKLKARGIKTVIVCGTSFQGVGIGTGSAAAQRGYKVIIPVDCLSSDNLYDEQYAAWHMYKGGPTNTTDNVTVTRSTMIKF